MTTTTRWVVHHSLTRGDADAICAAVEAQFKKARSKWLKAQRESGAAQKAVEAQYVEACAEERRLRGKVEETMREAAKYSIPIDPCDPSGTVSRRSEDDEEWRQFWRVVDKLGVLVAKARAAVKARRSVELKLAPGSQARLEAEHWAEGRVQ